MLENEEFGKEMDANYTEDLIKLSLIRRTVMSLFSNDFLFDTLTGLINDSKIISFASQLSATVDRTQPVVTFTLAIDEKSAIDKYTSQLTISPDDQESFYKHVIKRELIDEYVTILADEFFKFKEDQINGEGNIDLDIFKDDIREDTIVDLISLSTTFGIIIDNTGREGRRIANVSYLR